MARVYLVILDPASNQRSEVSVYNPNGNPKLPGFYVGYTGKTEDERFEEHLISNPLIRDSNPLLLSGVSDLFGCMDQATARAAEGYLAELVRRQKYCCTSDAWIEEHVKPKIEGAAIVSDRSTATPWRESKFTLRNDGLFFGPELRECVTEGIEALRRKIGEIGASFGQYVPGGRFALNAHGQIIRRLMPPAGIDRIAVFAVGVKEGQILTHTHPVFFKDGTVVPLRGRAITDYDKCCDDVPLVSLDRFRKLEPEIIRLVTEALASYKKGD